MGPHRRARIAPRLPQRRLDVRPGAAVVDGGQEPGTEAARGSVRLLERGQGKRDLTGFHALQTLDDRTRLVLVLDRQLPPEVEHDRRLTLGEAAESIAGCVLDVPGSVPWVAGGQQRPGRRQSAQLTERFGGLAEHGIGKAVFGECRVNRRHGRPTADAAKSPNGTCRPPQPPGLEGAASALLIALDSAKPWFRI